MDDDTTDDDNFQTNPGDINPLYKMKQDEKLPEDYDTPFSPPEGVRDRIDDKFPETDSAPDPHERYDAGIEQASGSSLPDEPIEEE